jgi:alpha-amylase
MSKAIVLYMHVHQPYRVRHYTVFDAAVNHDYFDAKPGERENNHDVLQKVAAKSYLPTNKYLLELLEQYPDFKLSLSITGTVLDQLEQWNPEALRSFQRLTETGRVEIVAETYHHSLAFFYSRHEFEHQVQMHREKVEKLFGQTPKVFRNTELAYNNELARWADQAGYTAVLSEGWDPTLGWRSPNHVYRPSYTNNVKLLMKNYKLSDDIAFRFGNQDWKEWPLTADKFSHWLSEDQDATNFNLFMDYETFGEHQWSESGIFDFLQKLPAEWLKSDDHTFMTVSEAATNIEAVGDVDIPQTVTWADTERDLSAWLGNAMQQEAIANIYGMQDVVLKTGDWELIEDWRRLQTSDHFYYMCTKWFSDGDIHAYFSPYETPYEAYINFMNACHDMRVRLYSKGYEI